MPDLRAWAVRRRVDQRRRQKRVCPDCAEQGRTTRCQTEKWCQGFCKRHAKYRGFSQPIKVAVVRKRLVGKQRDPGKAMKMRKNGARAGRDWAMVATPPAKRQRQSIGTPAKVACDGTREPFEPSLTQPCRRLVCRRVARDWRHGAQVCEHSADHATRAQLEQRR